MSESASDESDYEHVSDNEMGHSGQCDKNGAIVIPMGATSVATSQDTGNYATIPDGINVTHIQNTENFGPKLENSSPASSDPIDATSVKLDDSGYEAIPDNKLGDSKEQDNKKTTPHLSDTAGLKNDWTTSTSPDKDNYETIPCGTDLTDIKVADKTAKEDNPVSSVSNRERSVGSDESGYEAIPKNNIGQYNYGNEGTPIQQLDETKVRNVLKTPPLENDNYACGIPSDDDMSLRNVIRAEGKPGKFGHNASITAVVHRPYL